MLEYDRIDVSEGIDTKKTSASKECKICHYWYTLKILVLNITHIFVTDFMVYYKKVLVLIISPLFILTFVT